MVLSDVRCDRRGLNSTQTCIEPFHSSLRTDFFASLISYQMKETLIDDDMCLLVSLRSLNSENIVENIVFVLF